MKVARERVWRLSLNVKVTLALAAVFVATVAVFLLVLQPLQREQARRLVAQDRRLVATLRDTYQRDLIYDLLSDNRPSLEVNLAELARQPGVLWVRLESDGRALAASADREVLQRLLPAGLPAALELPGSGPPVLLLRADSAALVGPGGRPLGPAGPLARERLPRWRDAAGPEFEEAPLEGAQGAHALYGLFELRAADVPYGRLHVLYTLAEARRSAELARTLFYGLVGTSFALLLAVLNLLIVRIVIVPVRRVMRAMRQAATGDLAVRLPHLAGDEIGSMAASFNRMAEDLAASKREVEDYSRNLEAMVAERTRALQDSEAALLRVKNHLATVIAHVGTGVVSLDGGGAVTLINHRAAELLGAAGAVEGRPFEALLAAGEGRPLAALVAPVVAGRAARAEGQVTLKLPRGRRTLSVVASALAAEPGTRAGSVVVLDDLTQILASQRLEAWKQAVEKVIHEIKNPLTPIGLAAETLETAYERDRARFDDLFPRAVRMILRCVDDLKALIGEFTQFSRLPKADVHMLDVNGLVEEALELYQTTPPEGIAVRVAVDPVRPVVDGDRDQLKRVLLNVVNNGIEAMAGRRGELCVTTRAAGGEVELVVSDQGKGVEDVERLFEPYYTTKVKGTGLGLLIARQIVEEHGGRVAVRSEVGVGTEVTIALPAAGRSRT